ncbi:MAG: ATP phosphoribosyltransferase regulatory subunit, partial [Tsuneonella sp.]
DAHGYDRVIPPLVEFETSMANRMSGVATRKMFRFVDPASLRTLALRSDITVQVGRIAATSMASAVRPLRLCYAGEVAVIASDQLDPARQRLQLGAELIGSDSAAAAGEIVALAIEALAAAGATGISVDFTLPDLVDTLAAGTLPLSIEAVEDVRRELDAKDAGALKAVGGESYLPLLYAAGPFSTAVEKLADIDAGGSLASRIDGLRTIAARVGDMARVTLDPAERHGFQYQSWFGFTLFADGVRGTLGRGGTYRLSDGEVATGFSLYIDPLVDALADEPVGDLLYLPEDHDRETAERMRAIGWRTIAALGSGEDAKALGCTHRLRGSEIESL